MHFYTFISSFGCILNSALTAKTRHYFSKNEYKVQKGWKSNQYILRLSQREQRRWSQMRETAGGTTQGTGKHVKEHQGNATEVSWRQGFSTHRRDEGVRGQVEWGGGTGEGNEWENSGNRERLMKEVQSSCGGAQEDRKEKPRKHK